MSLITCHRDGEIERLGSPPTSTARAPTPETHDTATESSLRHALATEDAGILLCTGGRAVAVRVPWSVEGMTAVTLDGALHGAPEEGCVREALASLRASPTGHAGTLVHAVRPP